MCACVRECECVRAICLAELRLSAPGFSQSYIAKLSTICLGRVSDGWVVIL